MASNSPWSVKGISPEDRESAKMAARKAGVPIGVWLSEKIREAGQEKEEPAETSSEQDNKPSRNSDYQGHIDPRFSFGPGQWRSAEHILSEGIPPLGPGQAPGYSYSPQFHAPPPPPAYQAPPQQPAYPAPPAAVPAVDDTRLRELQQKLQTLDDKIVATEHKLAEAERQLVKAEQKRQEAVQPAMLKIEELEEEIAELRENAGNQSHGGASTAPIERAVMRIAERLQKVEDLTLPDSEPGFFSKLFRRD